MGRRWDTLKARVFPSEDLPLEHQFFQGLCLVGGLLALFVVMPVNKLQSLDPMVNWVVFAIGLLCLTAYWATRHGYFLAKAVFFSLMVCLDLAWFANGGSQGSIGLFYFAAILFMVVIFHGIFRWVAVVLLIINVVGLHWAEWVWPHLSRPFLHPADRLLDLITGYVLSFMTCVLMLWVVLKGFFRERRKLQDSLGALQTSEEKFERIFHGSPDGLVILESATGNILEASEGFDRLTGFSREMALGHTFENLNLWQSPSDQQRLHAMSDRSESFRGFEACFLREGGTSFWGEISHAPLRFEGKDCVLVTLRDITERRKAEEALRKASAAVEQSPVAIVITDLTATIEYVNAAFTRTTGYTAKEALGQNTRMLRSGEHPEAFYEELWRVLLAGQTWEGKFHNRAKDGSLYWERTTISPVFSSEGKITNFVATKENITESLTIEEERRRLESMVQQAQKMESLGSLAGGVAHDFNNMLGGIMGYADLLLADERDPKRRRYLEAVLAAASRSGELTRKLLAFGRRGKNLAESVSLEGAIHECLALLKPSLIPQISVETVLEPDLRIDGDPSQIHQVIVNLCINALDAMAEQGTLRISSRLHEIGEHEARALQLAQGLYADIRVSDTGVGMSEEVRQRIFEPFFTTKASEGSSGTGLGLSTVYGIVHGHGGAIEVASTRGRGTTFRVIFPQGKLAPAIRSHEAIPAQGAGRVLVVEDEPLLRELAGNALEGLGFSVSSAQDGAEGVKLFSEFHGELRAVLLDLKMPGMGGAEAFRAMHDIDSNVPVIICTGYGENEEVQQILHSGAAGMLSKPYRIADLSQVLERLARK